MRQTRRGMTQSCWGTRCAAVEPRACAREDSACLPRAHDCIGLLMGSRDRFQSYFDAHSGVYFRSPGWIENQAVDGKLQPAYSAMRNSAWAQQTREQLIAQYGIGNGNYLFEQFNAYRCRYSRLAYISTGVETDEACRSLALAEADAKAGPLKKSRARSRYSSVLSMAIGMRRIFWSCLQARASEGHSANPLWKHYERRDSAHAD